MKERKGGRILFVSSFFTMPVLKCNSQLEPPQTATCSRLLQVAEALLHMQVRLGMLKADDIPSLQAPPTPAVVGGAIMLGTGAVLPQLVRIIFQVYKVNQSSSIVYRNIRPHDGSISRVRLTEAFAPNS